MDLAVLSQVAASFILKALGNSEGAKTARKELSTALWEWIKPLFLKEEPELVAEVEQGNTSSNTESRLAQAIEEKAATDQKFLLRLVHHLETLEEEGMIKLTYQQAQKIVEIKTNYGTINIY
ncbi:MAG: hypothetical protein D6732_07495 [Methanobacteriota archaeon]|nr:MAG: hypothetical protein D6732_07495 [Euryarchaeota archaeon]